MIIYDKNHVKSQTPGVERHKAALAKQQSSLRIRPHRAPRGRICSAFRWFMVTSRKLLPALHINTWITTPDKWMPYSTRLYEAINRVLKAQHCRACGESSVFEFVMEHYISKHCGIRTANVIGSVLKNRQKQSAPCGWWKNGPHALKQMIKLSICALKAFLIQQSLKTKSRLWWSAH